MTKAVRSIVEWNGVLYIGGSFPVVANMEVGHIASWSGKQVLRLGGGLDGAVNALIVYHNLVVVGGSFMQAYKSRSEKLHTGGLAAWNGTAWSDLGGSALVGSIDTMAVNGTTLFVAGRFSQIGTRNIRTLAAFDGATWSSVGDHDSMEGGEIAALTVSSRDLWVGGGFYLRGHSEMVHVARWDGAHWHPLWGLNGNVRGIVKLGDSIYLGGDFTMAGDLAANHVVRFANGEWSALESGVNDRVYALELAHGCLYLGGSFSQINAHRGSPGKAFCLVATLTRSSYMSN